MDAAPAFKDFDFKDDEQPEQKSISLTFFNDLKEPTPKPWLIKNVIARGEASSWIAPPGNGKSALLTDIGINLANGTDWRGYRTKKQCGVVYFALERADLVRRRLIAHKMRDSLSDSPIAIASEVIDLMDKEYVETIVHTVAEAEQRFGCGVGLCIFDTYAKAIAAGGGDESSAKDQNIALANLRRVLDRVDVHIAGIDIPVKTKAKASVVQMPDWQTLTCKCRLKATSSNRRRSKKPMTNHTGR